MARLIAAAVLTLVSLSACGRGDPPATSPVIPVDTVPAATEHATAHYRIASTADAATTQAAGDAAEALFAAYADFLSLPRTVPAPLRIRLYAGRAEFKANNRSRPWAEAYYVDGVCHAYADPDRATPQHWLLHEAVHQLNRDVAGVAKEKWINEGLATYFGGSRYVDGQVQAGVPDFDTYPLWWLARWELSGDWAADVQAQRVVPLRALVTGQGGPPMDGAVNAYYLGWWSLTHFLLHHDGGRHADAFRRLLRDGASLARFEAEVGPVEAVEPAWYAYLQARANDARAAAGGDRTGG